MRCSSLLLAVCAVSGHSAWGAGAFRESGGLVVVEVESAPVVAPWVLETSRGGYTGSSYYRMTVDDFDRNPPHAGELVYRINITNAGTYRLRILGQKPDVGDIGAFNDCWVKMVGQPGAKGVYNKVFKGGAAGVRQWDTTYDIDHKLSKVRFDLSAGEHELRIAGRSRNYMIDRFILFDENKLYVQEASDYALPQSSTTPGDRSVLIRY